jgi:hypothetical protein
MAFWNNDYEKITEYYVKLVKKFLKSISEENSIVDSNNNSKTISITNNGNIINKENNNINNIKTTATMSNKENLIIMKKESNNNMNEMICYTELNNNNSNQNINNINNKNKKNINNNPDLNLPFQNGGIDIRINTYYEDKASNIVPIVPNNPIKNFIDKKNHNHNPKYNVTKNEIEEDSEEPRAQKINESYRPKITMQEFLQTDANNIKMNNRLIKE